jgi:hypothetical protein
MGRDNCKKKLVSQPLNTASPMICKPTTGPNLRSNDLLHLSPNWVLLNGMEMEVSAKKNGTISLAPLLLPQLTKEMLVISLLDSACINVLCQNLNSMKLE